MCYKSLKECVLDLEKHGHLLRIKEEVNPHLEMAEIHRQVNAKGGPAVFFENVTGSSFPAVSNLFGTEERARFMFRHNLKRVKWLVEQKANPAELLRQPLHTISSAFLATKALPWRVRSGPVLARKIKIEELPWVHSWPKDGGPFILLPQVYTENPNHPKVMASNLGMYRVQLAGNDYKKNEEIGLHYQIRRDIGIHHRAAAQRGEKLKVSIFVGGPPSHTFSAVMYLPEGLSELTFAGMLNGRSFRYIRRDGFVLSAEADFCITGYVDPKRTLPEGPFGDHLGYYSLQHPFPVLEVESVYAREDAIWPFTVVGRPPQEDSVFGKLIQEIAKPMIPKEIPGVKAVHAVDASGVHPLMLAIGSERYTPYEETKRPQEILTLANALLGYGPCSLAKYLWIVAGEDNPELDVHEIEKYFQHVLERVDWRRDLHFQTATTMDTLDYSGEGLNQGSKLVIAAVGPKRRELGSQVPAELVFPEGFSDPQIVMPGVLALKGPQFESQVNESERMKIFEQALEKKGGLESFPWIVLCDDSEFTAKTLSNFLWVTFTRSNPAADVYGVGSSIQAKHWGCTGSLIIDARMKPHHAPPLEVDSGVVEAAEKILTAAGCKDSHKSS